jgi:cell division protein FtsW
MLFHQIKSINLINASVIVLLVIGIYFIFNATVVSSFETYNNPFRFSLAHLVWVLIGLVAYFLVQRVEIRFFKKINIVIYIISLSFLGILALSKLWGCTNPLGVAPCVNGAIRWLVLNPYPVPEIPFLGRVTIQPSEIAKLSLTLMLSAIFSSTKLDDYKKVFWSIAVSIPVILLVFIQPNKSTSFILFFIFFSIYLTYGKFLKYLWGLIAVGSVIFLYFVFSNSYSYQRVATFLSINESEKIDYHQEQILISLGSGGLFGIGGGMSRQKFSYLPEISSDSIFAIIGEELGFLGSIAVIFIFVFLIYQGFLVASFQKDEYQKLITVGISSWIGIQAVINIGSMAHLFPLTGVPLPLISYGGTSTIILLLSLGIIVNISKKYYGK